MLYGSVQGVDKKVSRLVLGTMIITIDEQERSFKLLDDCLAQGCTTLDTAHGYAGGNSERCIGAWMEARGNRDEVVVLSKCSHPNGDRKRVTPFDIASDLHDSLARLRSEYVDIYVLHRDDVDKPVGPIVEALNEHHAAGRIHAFGGSNWRHDRIQEANEYADKHGLVPFTASSPNYGLAEQVEDPWGPGCVTLSGPKEADSRAWYLKTNTPIFAYSSLGRGFFSGRVTREAFEKNPEIVDGACRRAYCHDVNFTRLERVQVLAKEKGLTVPQVAVAFIINQPLNVFALCGCESGDEMQANVQASELKLTAAELAWLDLQSEER